MKRFFVLASTLFMSTSIFAKDFMGDLSNAGGFFIVLFILMFVWGVLQIILFFKIWGMTNNVKAMKKEMFNETAFSSDEKMANYIRKNIVLGNEDNVRRVLLQNFMDKVLEYYEKLQKGVTTKTKKGYYETVHFTNEEIMEFDIKPNVEILKNQFRLIGAELPICIQQMSSLGDYIRLFKKEDLEYKKLELPEVKKEE